MAEARPDVARLIEQLEAQGYQVTKEAVEVTERPAVSAQLMRDLAVHKTTGFSAWGTWGSAS